MGSPIKRPPVKGKKFSCARRVLLQRPGTECGTNVGSRSLFTSSRSFFKLAVAVISSLHQSPIRIKADRAIAGAIGIMGLRSAETLDISERSKPIVFSERPLSAFADPENLRFHGVSKWMCHKSYGLRTNPFMAHDMGSKEIRKPLMGGTASQSSLVVLPTPLQVHRSTQLLCKELVWIEGHTILHDIVRCPG